MDVRNSLYYIELSKNPIRFDAESQITEVFFDDSNRQIFTVRSGGATGVVVKGPTEDDVISFCMSDRGGPIRSVKFSCDNQILAVQRRENAVEFICFQGDVPNLQNVIVQQMKSLVNTLVWVHTRECAIITNSGIEIFTIIPEKRATRSVKALSISIKWFAWCSEGNIALLCTQDTNSLIPVIIKQKTITKLPKLELGNIVNKVEESKVTLSQVYGVTAVFILQPNSSTSMMEVVIYTLNGPGLAPRKSHILQLGLVGRFAISTVDNLIVVHHQAHATSLLFDIALNGELRNDVMYHIPVIPARSIKPFALKLPSLSPDGQTLQCDLYSEDWVLFQPNIVIDSKLGCMWYLNLSIEPLCSLISDRIRLTEFLLQRSNGKNVLLKVLRQLCDEQYNGNLLPVLETIFNKINKFYGDWVLLELQTQTAQPTNLKTMPKLPAAPRVLIQQSDMIEQVFAKIPERPYTETILMLYLQSLNKNNIAAQEELSKLIISELIRNHNLSTLRRLVDYSLILESKPIACYLLSHSNIDVAISQMALDMLHKIKAYEIIIEILLGQGRVIDALRLGKLYYENDKIPVRKFFEAAVKSKDDTVFFSVYKFFQMHFLRVRGSMEFPKAEQCHEFVQYYNNMCGKRENESKS